MSIELKRIDSLEAVDRNRWNHVVEQADLGCVYHRYGWLRAIEAGTGHEPRHLLVSKAGNPIAIFPNFLTDVGPFRQLTSITPGFGGPVVVTDEETVIERLLAALPELYDGHVFFSQIRTFDEGYVRYHDLLEEHGYALSTDWCRFTLDLTRGWEELFERMSRSRRRAIRNGREQEYDVVDEELTRQSLSGFYDGFAAVMERVGRIDLPRSFFLELRRFDDRVKLFSLSVDGARRGSLLFVLDDERSAVHYAYSAVREEHFEYHASELLHEHAIRWAIDQGYETYDLRGARSDFKDGLFGFKEQFGGRVTPLCTWERGYPVAALDVGRSLLRG